MGKAENKFVPRFEDIWLAFFYLGLWLYIAFAEIFLMPAYKSMMHAAGKEMWEVIVLTNSWVEPAFWLSVVSLPLMAVLARRGTLSSVWLKGGLSLLFVTAIVLAVGMTSAWLEAIVNMPRG